MAICKIKTNINVDRVYLAKQINLLLKSDIEKGIYPSFNEILKSSTFISMLESNLSDQDKNMSNIFVPELIYMLRDKSTKEYTSTTRAWLNSDESQAFRNKVDTYNQLLNSDELRDVDDSTLIYEATKQFIEDNPDDYNSNISTDIVEGDTFVVSSTDKLHSTENVEQLVESIKDNVIRGKVAVFLDYITTGNINTLINKVDTGDVIKLINRKLIEHKGKIPVIITYDEGYEAGIMARRYVIKLDNEIVGTMQDMNLFADAKTNELSSVYKQAVEIFGEQLINKRLDEFNKLFDNLVNTNTPQSAYITGMGKGNYNYYTDITTPTNIKVSELYTTDENGNPKYDLPAGLSVSNKAYIDMSKYKLKNGLKLTPDLKVILNRVLEKFNGSVQLMMTTTPSDNEHKQVQQWYIENPSYLKAFLLTSFGDNTFDAPIPTMGESSDVYYQNMQDFFSKYGKLMLDVPSFTFKDLMDGFRKGGKWSKLIGEIQDDENQKTVNKAKLGFTFTSPTQIHNALTIVKAILQRTNGLVLTDRDKLNRQRFKDVLINDGIYDAIVSNAQSNAPVYAKSELGSIFLNDNTYGKELSDEAKMDYMFSYLSLVQEDGKYKHPLDIIWDSIPPTHPIKNTITTSLTAYLQSKEKRASPMNIITGMVVNKVGNVFYDEQKVLQVLANKLDTNTINGVQEGLNKLRSRNGISDEYRFPINAMIMKPSINDKKSVYDIQSKVGGIAEVNMATMGKLGIEYTIPKLPIQPNLLLSVESTTKELTPSQKLDAFLKLNPDRRGDIEEEIYDNEWDINNLTNEQLEQIERNHDIICSI